jgi:hypothetical protein
MNPKIMPFFSYRIVISLLIFISIAGGLAFGQGGGMETPEFARLRIERLRQTAKTLQELAHQPLPLDLPASEQNEAKRFSLWLKNSSQRLYDLANRWQAALDTAVHTKTNDPKKQTSSMRDMIMSFNLQYLMLQNKISHENRQFSLVSNIMKNKHDTAKNSINNIR